MDTFSSTVSTFKAPPIPHTNREFHHFKRTPYATANRTPQPHVSSTSINSLLVPRTNNKPFSHKSCCSTTSLPFSSSRSTTSSSSQLQHPSSPIFHASTATGYAAAVIDVAQSSNSLHVVHRDVQRLLRFLQIHPDWVDDEELKGQVLMRNVVVQDDEQGGSFHRHVAALLKMLLKKNRLGIVHQVLEEFERIYDELCGTQVVLVSSTTKMGEDQLFGIAKRVHQLSGAVRVKLRNVVQENCTNSPSFAV